VTSEPLKVGNPDPTLQKKERIRPESYTIAWVFSELRIFVA